MSDPTRTSLDDPCRNRHNARLDIGSPWTDDLRSLAVYAIIEDGSHQYKVEEGQVFEVQLHDLDEGQTTVDFDKVLLVGGDGDPRIGQPYLAGAKVSASIIDPEIKGAKITIQKFKRRKNYARKTGHRQRYLRVKVDSISA